MPNVDINNDQMLSLAQAKNYLLNTTDPSLSLLEVRNMNRNLCQFFECDLVYLHVQIIFKSSNEVDDFLAVYCDLHGLYATQMFVNHILLDGDELFNITPIDCAVLWTQDPQMIRVLYKWGADTSIPTINERAYNNENSVLPYRNYFSRYVLMENLIPDYYPAIRGRRIQNEFQGIINEVSYIQGILPPPEGWTHPPRMRPPQNINASTNQY
ncbi:MAG: hypothetical protein ACR2M6_03130 [Vampirovibrionia bacterium]